MRTILLIAVALFLALPAAAGTIRGKVSLEPAESKPLRVNRYAGRESLGKHTETHANKPASQPAVVYLTQENPGKLPKPARRARMEQVDETFKPSLLPVQLGTVVDFPNSDPIFHNVFSYSKAKKFDLGRYHRGKSKSVKFDQPGVVSVFCEIHTSMRAYILVLETPWFTTTDESGAFVLEDIPEGEYLLHVWRENQPEAMLKVTVTATETLKVAL